MSEIFKSASSPLIPHSSPLIPHSSPLIPHSSPLIPHFSLLIPRPAFTLIELLVVVGMIAILMGAITTSFASAQERARVQKATAEVKVISQAILAYENWSRGGKFELTPMGGTGPADGVDADKSSLSFLLGNETAESGGNIPAMLMAQLQGGGKMRDPWGTPYKVQIKEGTISAAQGISLQTGYALPNFYRTTTEPQE